MKGKGMNTNDIPLYLVEIFILKIKEGGRE